MTTYREFVKANFHKLPSDMLAKHKMAEIGKMWRASGQAKGKGVSGGSVAGGRLRKRGRGVAGGGVSGGDVEGGGILSGILDSIGLGVAGGKMKKTRKAKGRGVAGGSADGSGLFSMINSLTGTPEKSENDKLAEAIKLISKHTKGSGVSGGDVEGGGILSGILGSIGLGMDGKGVSGGSLLGGKGGMRKMLQATPVGGDVSFFGPIQDAIKAMVHFNLANGKGVSGGGVSGGNLVDFMSDIKDGMKDIGQFGMGKGVSGGNFADFMHGIGNHLLGKGVSGGGVAGGSAEGGGILSGLLGAIGLGMPEHIKAKHFKNMCMLEKKLHAGSITPAEHHKLKSYHVLHGAGFFDSLWGGIKKGVNFAADNIGSIVKAVPEIIKHAPGVLKMVGI